MTRATTRPNDKSSPAPKRAASRAQPSTGENMAKPKLDEDAERERLKALDMDAIDAARAKAGNISPRDMAELERAAVAKAREADAKKKNAR
jgi:hypothetical protein